LRKKRYELTFVSYGLVVFKVCEVIFQATGFIGHCWALFL